MYLVVYGWVHMCTLPYQTEYICDTPIIADRTYDWVSTYTYLHPRLSSPLPYQTTVIVPQKLLSVIIPPPTVRGSTHMYPDVYQRVHTCTLTYTREYMYVSPRIRQGTCMYPHVYIRVHVCTQSHTARFKME